VHPAPLPDPSSSSSLTLTELLHAATDPSTLSSDVVQQIIQLQDLAHSLTPQLLQSAGIDAATLATLNALTAKFAAHPSGISSQPPSGSSSAPSAPSASSPPPVSPSGYHVKQEAYSKRHRDSDVSTGSKRSKPDSSASTPSADDALSPRLRLDGLNELVSSDDGGESDSEAASDCTVPHGPLSPSSFHPLKRRSEEVKVRNEQQRKRQHQKSDKQRRAKIKDGMEQLKALVSQHGKLESPDQASIVSASVDLVHSLRSEIAALKAEVDRGRVENMQNGRAGFAQLDSAHLLRGLGALSASSLSQLSQLNQLQSLSQLNSQLASLQGHGLSGLNALNNLNVLSSLGLPTNINSTLTNSMGPPHSNPGHSPMPVRPPLSSPPALAMAMSSGNHNFTNSILSSSPPAQAVMEVYGKDHWG
jgi:hypothetical protein